MLHIKPDTVPYELVEGSEWILRGNGHVVCVVDNDDQVVLRLKSYDTYVAEYVPSCFELDVEPHACTWSPTTTRHVTEFARWARDSHGICHLCYNADTDAHFKLVARAAGLMR